MLLTWDREYDLPDEDTDLDPAFDLDGPPEEDDDDYDLGTSYTYVESEDDDEDDDFDFDDDEEDDGYGDDASVGADDQPVMWVAWVGPSGIAWKVDIYVGDNE